MADNIDATPGTGKTLAFDDIAGVFYQRVKPVHGADGSATDTSTANPLPVTFTDDPGVTITGTPDVAVTNTPSITGSVNLVPATTGGLTIFRSIDLDESEEEIKATAGQIYGLFISNLHASSRRYIKFYNATAASVTVGTTTPVITIPFGADKEGWVPFPTGIAFGTAISVAATTGLADNDTGAPGANEVVVNVFYK